jgi:hypothetical protein
VIVHPGLVAPGLGASPFDLKRPVSGLAEVGEAIDAWRKDRQAVAEELADVASFLFGRPR